MAKAEQFIKDYTRNCSNEVDYSQINREGSTPITPVLDFHPWLTPDQAERAVEIAREELIEKACKFWGNKAIKAEEGDIEYYIFSCLEEFKKYLEK